MPPGKWCKKKTTIHLPLIGGCHLYGKKSHPQTKGRKRRPNARWIFFPMVLPILMFPPKVQEKWQKKSLKQRLENGKIPSFKGCGEHFREMGYRVHSHPCIPTFFVSVINKKPLSPLAMLGPGCVRRTSLPCWGQTSWSRSPAPRNTPQAGHLFKLRASVMNSVSCSTSNPPFFISIFTNSCFHNYSQSFWISTLLAMTNVQCR